MNYCKVLILSILNIICFLLSVVFLSSVNNIRDQADFLAIYQICDFSLFDYSKYYNYFIGITILSSFSFCGFLIFLIGLFCYISNQLKNKYKNIEKEKENDKIEDTKSNNTTINRVNIINIVNDNNFENENNNKIKANENIINSKSIINSNNNSNIDQNKKENNGNDANCNTIIVFNNKINYILNYSFIFCHILYLIETIIITVFYKESKEIVEKYKIYYYCNIDNLKCLTRICQNLMIVGYVFLFIFSIFYIFLLFVKLFPNKNRIFSFINCINCTSCFIKKIKEEDDIEEYKKIYKNKTKDELNNIINDLEDYKNKLERLNEKIKAKNAEESELKELNLYKIKSYQI